MGEIIHVQFGTEREWESTHQKLIDGLCSIGQLFGDDPVLMKAKADRTYALLRQIVEDFPNVQVTTRIPDNLNEEQMKILTNTIKEATLKGIEAAMSHSVPLLMGAIYDLCTSKLSPRHT